jgi:hypothetical protein
METLLLLAVLTICLAGLITGVVLIYKLINKNSSTR